MATSAGPARESGRAVHASTPARIVAVPTLASTAISQGPHTSPPRAAFSATAPTSSAAAAAAATGRPALRALLIAVVAAMAAIVSEAGSPGQSVPCPPGAGSVAAPMTVLPRRRSVAGMSRSLALAALTLLLVVPTAHADRPRAGDRWPAAAEHHTIHAPRARAAAARVSARAQKASGTELTACDDPPGTLCGSIDVPLDRRHPGGATIPIFFAVVPHRDPGPAAGTILASEGGPGFSSTAAAD